MPDESQQDDDWNGYPQQPEKNSAAHRCLPRNQVSRSAAVGAAAISSLQPKPKRRDEVPAVADFLPTRRSSWTEPPRVIPGASPRLCDSNTRAAGLAPSCRHLAGVRAHRGRPVAARPRPVRSCREPEAGRGGAGSFATDNSHAGIGIHRRKPKNSQMDST